MTVRKARANEINTVIAFYHSLIDAMEGAEYGPGWEKEIYPTSEFIRESVEKGELFLAEKEENSTDEMTDDVSDNIAGVMVINHECNESYDKYEWKTAAKKDEISVIHALGVHPRYARQGVGRLLVEEAIRICRENRQKAIRLDVLKGNLPAEKLYCSMGFSYLATLPMFYEDTGWTDYELYEILL